MIRVGVEAARHGASAGGGSSQTGEATVDACAEVTVEVTVEGGWEDGASSGTVMGASAVMVRRGPGDAATAEGRGSLLGFVIWSRAIRSCIRSATTCWSLAASTAT